MYCAPKEGEPVAQAYYEKGFNCFVLEYSCTLGLFNSPKVNKEEVCDAALEDAMNAYYYIKDNNKDFNINENKISIVGFSAGANLALASVVTGGLKPLSLILGYGAFSKEIFEPLEMNVEDLLKKIKDDMPPAFMFLCQADTTVASSESLNLALEYAKRKIPYELHIYVAGDHGLSLGNEKSGIVNKDYATWFNHSLSFLNNIQLETPIHLGDISRDLELLSTDSRIGALMYHEKAWKLIEEVLPEVAKKTKEDINFGHRPLSRLYDWGMIDKPSKEELNEMLKKCK